MTAPAEQTALLEVDDLVVTFRSAAGLVHAVSSVSFEVHRGETVAIVGESGSDKTVTMLSMPGLVPAATTSGSARLDGEDLLAAGPERLRALRGKRVGVVFQDPMTSLNPVIPVGEQIREAIWVHDRDGARADHVARAVALLQSVGVPDAARRAEQ
ncbi:MAG: ABC transporter ATP-binding protein, partial [Actinobacteria bacterium]|nr:ABC transporter ATP-binding protein [Actinomycetota bacterium]